MQLRLVAFQHQYRGLTDGNQDYSRFRTTEVPKLNAENDARRIINR